MSCLTCSKSIKIRDSWEGKKRKFCSLQCYWKSMEGYTPKSPPPHGPLKYKECPVCKIVFRLRRSTSINCSKKCAGIAYSKKVPKTYCVICGEIKRNDTVKYCSTKCFGIGTRKENSPSWKGGIKKDKDRRKSFEGAQWRKAVFERDNYTCQLCGGRGGYLEADHIKAYAIHVELRYELANGRTLCKTCHRKTPNYGSRARLDK